MQILERGVPIARLVGLQSTTGSVDERKRVERLTKAGILRRGTGDLSWLLAERPLEVECIELSDAVSDDREDRI